MSDKELIKQEIERLKHSTPNAYDRGRFMLLSEIEDFIDSLPEEPANEGLDEAAKEHAANLYGEDWIKNEHVQDNGFKAISNFKFGAGWQKQQMMKNVVLETKVMKDCDGDGIETPYAEWLTLENTEIPYIPDNLGLKEGDKVKIIIMKEEQQ